MSLVKLPVATFSYSLHSDSGFYSIDSPFPQTEEGEGKEKRKHKKDRERKRKERKGKKFSYLRGDDSKRVTEPSYANIISW